MARASAETGGTRELRRAIAENQTLPDEVVTLLREAPRDADPMDVLRTAVSALAFYDKGAKDIRVRARFAPRRSLRVHSPCLSPRLTAFATAKTRRAETGTQHRRHFLYMLKGEMPSEREACIFDARAGAARRHELNASTFTGRVVAATLADMYGAITAAIAALSGPLHAARTPT